MGVCAFFVIRQVPSLAAGPLIAAAVVVAASFFYPVVIRNKIAALRHPHRYTIGMGVLMGTVVIVVGGAIAWLTNVAAAAAGGHALALTAAAMGRSVLLTRMLLMGTLHGAIGGFTSGLALVGIRPKPPSD